MPQTCCRCALAAIVLLLLAPATFANTITYVIKGVQEPLLSNVRAHVEQFALTGNRRISPRRFDQIAGQAEERTREALKPYGYYDPEIETSLTQSSEDRWRLEIRIRRGPPIVVSEVAIEARGGGKDDGWLREWRRAWPLSAGTVLNQLEWKQAKEAALEAAAASGYLTAGFVKHDISIDLARRTARLDLVLDTGPRVLFGQIRYDQDVVEPWVLERIPRFDPGTPYNAELLAQYRLDLWRSGNFTDIEVREERRLDQSPPVVDLHVALEAKTRNTWQGAIGVGTDTGFRLQAQYSRHPLSSRGDRLDIGTGYRQIDDEFSFRADYRIPRRSAKRQFWTARMAFRSENQDLEIKRSPSADGFIKLANGNVQDLNARIGRLHVRDRDQGLQQIFETVFAQIVRESFRYTTGADAEPGILAIAGDPTLSRLFRDTFSTIALGIEWDWPSIRGKGFSTEGHRERAWLFTANEAWGSDRDFTQLYVSTRRSWLVGERWKFLLRAEAGYSDADVNDLTLDIGGEPLSLSVTALPDIYRFKTGGSSSVRGYSFESLSNNDIGSNNIIAGGVEAEFRVHNNWSVAAFADIGNAFNDWDAVNLQKGVGVGVRWYSIVGPIRLDVAQAIDVEGRPWRVHFTMGSPLL